MALRLLETGKAPRLRGAHADLWRTVSGWLWTTYLFAIASMLLWWTL